MSTQSSELVSGEGVALDLQRAGVGSRVVAALVDAGVQLGAVLFLLYLFAAAAIRLDTAALQAVILVLVIAIFAGYPIMMEWLLRGRTLGKMALGLRVVRDDGGPIGLRQAMVRGVAGLVLEKPGLLFPISTTAGFLTLLFSSRDKRLGDMMAGTFVLNERSATARPSVPQYYAVPYQLQPWAASVDLSGVDDALALSLRQFVIRAWEMSPAGQYALGEQLRARVEPQLRPPPPPGVPTPWLLVSVLAERRRRSEPVAAAPVGFWPAPAPSYPTAVAAASPVPPAPPPGPFAPPS